MLSRNIHTPNAFRYASMFIRHYNKIIRLTKRSLQIVEEPLNDERYSLNARGTICKFPSRVHEESIVSKYLFFKCAPSTEMIGNHALILADRAMKENSNLPWLSTSCVVYVLKKICN